MTITGEKCEFLRNIITMLIKGVEFDMCTIINSTLYLLVNHGIVYKVDLSNYIDVNTTCTFNKESLISNSDYIFDLPELQHNLITKIIDISNVENNNYPLIYHEENCRDNEVFETMINSNSGDGSFRYFIDTSVGRTFIILYKSIFKCNKQDKVSVKIYDIGNGYFVSVFTIYKAKFKMNIDMRFQFINMIKE